MIENPPSGVMETNNFSENEFKCESTLQYFKDICRLRTLYFCIEKCSWTFFFRNKLQQIAYCTLFHESSIGRDQIVPFLIFFRKGLRSYLRIQYDKISFAPVCYEVIAKSSQMFTFSSEKVVCCSISHSFLQLLEMLVTIGLIGLHK